MRNLLALLLLAPCALLAQVPDYLPADGLLAWYPFNGNSDDESGNGLDGTVDGAALTEDRTGAASSAYAFDGANRISTAGSPFNGQTALTFYAWIQSDNPAPYSVLMSEWPAGGATFKLDHSVTDEFLRFDLITSDGYHSASIDFTASQWADWSHFLAVYDGTTIQLYLNGDAIGTPVPASGSISATAGEMLIGDEANNSAPFQGRLDDIALWGRALTAAEIEAVYEAGLPNPTASAGVFDGDDHIWLTDADFLNFGQSSFTAHVQFRPTDLSTLNECCGYQTLLAKGAAQGSGNKGFNLDLRGEPDDARINCRITTSQGVDVTVTCPIEEDLWYDMVYIVDWETDTVSLFVNGFLIQQESIVELGNMNNGWYPTIGRFVWNNSNGYDGAYFLGEMSGVRVLEGADYEMGLNPCVFRENVVLQVLDFTAEEVAAQVNSAFNIDEVIDVDNPCGGFSATYGCADPTACNYSEEADLNDGSCIPSGCTDATACNYSPEAGCDNGNCDYSCCPGPGCCGEGMAWSDSLQLCVITEAIIDSIFVPIPSCGAGTVWDPIAEECIIAVPTDNNFDGCITAGDVLNLLATFGTCPPIPEWPDTPSDTTDTSWMCGNPLPHQGYDYATVQIGDQCWFAENCRYLPSVSPPNEGSEGDGAPHSYVQGFSGSSVSDAIQTQSYSDAGALYNAQAAMEWDLCPSGWHISTDVDWILLETHLGMPQSELENIGWRGSDEGLALKSSAADQLPWDGSNSTGFNALPNGNRAASNANWNYSSSAFYVWSINSDNGELNGRELRTSINGIYRSIYPAEDGFSVRCLKD